MKIVIEFLHCISLKDIFINDGIIKPQIYLNYQYDNISKLLTYNFAIIFYSNNSTTRFQATRSGSCH